ncbi:hypothetical protein H6784_04600 [Candidatus Nomurabacteria bacterium]|nr:hypothetical protein [Candidatus Kaiserbacteria bacterium]MCB9814668.1 hypothetical protein [Candidatus Nomurabacteria bacterium]
MSGTNGCQQPPLVPGTVSGTTRRPTVIGDRKGSPSHSATALQDRKPTVLGSKPAPVANRPTTMMGESPPATVSQERKSTVISHVQPSMTVSEDAPKKPFIVSKPSVIPGTVRKGFVVETADLKKAFVGSSHEVIVRAVILLRGTIVETLNTSACSQWGAIVGQRYGVLVNEALTHASSKAIRDGASHMRRLYRLLEEVAQAFQKKSSKGRFWEKAKTPWEKFHDVQAEVDQLRVLLGNVLPGLREVQVKLGNVSTDLLELSSEIEAWSIAACFLADTLGQNDQRSSHLMDQSISLAKMIALIQEGVLMREDSIREVDALADRIQEGVLVTLPAWIEKVVHVSQKTSHTETDSYTLRQGIENIIQCIKP